MTAAAVAPEYLRLMAAARDPADIATLALGGVLSRFPIRGLDTPALNRLLHRYFPGAPGTQGVGALCTALSADEFEDLLALLRAHRRDDSEETDWVARAIVSACGGENHLWEDMGLPDRDTLSRLIRRYFTTLYYRNTGNLKWKKFFYRQLCDRAAVKACRAPSCGVCCDYAQCFGPE